MLPRPLEGIQGLHPVDRGGLDLWLMSAATPCPLSSSCPSQESRGPARNKTGVAHAAAEAPRLDAGRSRRTGTGRFRRQREVFLAYLLLAPAVALVLGLQAFPLAWQVRLSLTNFSPMARAGAAFVGFRNYLEFLSDPGFWLAAANTAGYISITGVLKLAVGIAIALILCRPFPGRPLVYLAAFLPWAYPAGVGIIAWYWYMTPPLHTSYGPVMIALRLFFDAHVGDGAWGFISLILFNIWRGGSFT